MKHMTKNDLEKIIDGINNYKDIKKIIENDKENLLKEYKRYVDDITGLMLINYGEDISNPKVFNQNGKNQDMDIIDVNNHKTYQNLIASFITQIAEAYSIVFNEKLNSIKDKYDMEMSILSQVIRLV